MPALGLLKPVRCASADDESAVDSASMAIEDAESERARFITTSCLLRSAPSRRSQIFETRNTSLSSRSGRSLHGTRKPVLTKVRGRMVRNDQYARAVVALRRREERSTGAHIEHEIRVMSFSRCTKSARIPRSIETKRDRYGDANQIATGFGTVARAIGVCRTFLCLRRARPDC